MNRFLISCCLVIVLVLQGMTVNTAASSDMHSSMDMHAHCHHMTEKGNVSQQNDCCNDHCASYNGCAVYCAVLTIPTSNHFIVPYQPIREEHSFVQWATSEPDYIPVNPPPII